MTCLGFKITTFESSLGPTEDKSEATREGNDKNCKTLGRGRLYKYF